MVSVPLSAALAIASNATPIMGLRAGLFAPLMAGAFGGSEYNIFGPAGALVNILAAIEFQYGVEVLPLVAILSGVVGFLSWAFELEKYLTVIP